ncbi:MAG: gfo/Idh/MocA family oxidoreductase [Planctomycetes bacterium]|nr:gfo/Idh/MocA family oxidoreductase [Planctomycetota bacterium]
MQRRQFLKAGISAGIVLPALARVSFANPTVRPRRVALIGSGWYGKCDLLRLIQVEPVEVVALCDVDSKMLADAAAIVASRQKSGREPATYSDYRTLLAERELDLVLVDTPDHWHALPTIAAMEAGADVWVQKPISIDVAEGFAMLDTARRLGRVVQVGTQRRSTPHLIEARDRIIRPGLLGKIALVETYCYYHMRPTGNPPDEAPPANLDYEMWTGPAPMRPYNKLVHPRTWRAFMEYSNGIIGDMCVHFLDCARWMLELGWPTRVDSTGGILVQKDAKANTPDTQTAAWDFGDLRMTWTHRSWGTAPDPDYPWGMTIYGDKGTLKLSVMRYDFIPTDKKAQPIHGDVVMELDQYPEDKTEKDLEKHVAPAIRGHMKDWLAAVDARTKPVADIEQGHISTASCILANLSLKLGRSLNWDPIKRQVPGDAEANALLTRAYRKPWVHPG